MKRFSLLLLAALAASTLSATIIYEQSFDYGDSSFAIRDNSDWDSTSGVVDFDPTTTLSDGQGFLSNPNTGSLVHDFGSGRRSASDTAAAADPFPSVEAGAELWMVALIQLNNANPSSALPSGAGTDISWTSGQSVNTWGFGVDGAGNVFLRAADDGGAASALDTGIDAVADGSTYLLISRATIGSGSSPTNSTVDFWFNPADASSVAALGAPDFTTGSDSKIGRDSGSYSALNYNLTFGDRIDEVRIGTEFASVIPEPSTYAMLVLGGLLLIGLARRRR